MTYYYLRLRRQSGRELVITWPAETARVARIEINLLYAPWWRVVEVTPKG